MRNTHNAADFRLRCPEPRSRAIIVQMVYWDADNFDPVKGSNPGKAGEETQFFGEDEHLSKVKDSWDA